MNRKQLTFSLILTVLFITPFIYAEESDSIDKDTAPELILKEEDFTYDEYKGSLDFIKNTLDKYYNNKIDKKRDWETENLGIPNSLLRLQGFGLFTQRDIIRLKLENAKLKGVKKEDITNLEKALKDIEKQIEDFLSKNIWYD